MNNEQNVQLSSGVYALGEPLRVIAHVCEHSFVVVCGHY